MGRDLTVRHHDVGRDCWRQFVRFANPSSRWPAYVHSRQCAADRATGLYLRTATCERYALRIWYRQAGRPGGICQRDHIGHDSAAHRLRSGGAPAVSSQDQLQ